MASLLDQVKAAILGSNKPRKPYQSGKKVETRKEKMCKAGDENACRSNQSTDSKNGY